MIVQIDGETIEVCEQVKIIYEIGDPETESEQELHIALTDEGLIADVIEEGDPDLKIMLLETGDAYLVEGNWWHDCYWGVCYCDKCMGTGQNKLGDFLMAVRDDSQAEDWSEIFKEEL